MVAITPSRKPPWTLILVIAFALAVDYLVYGVILPLTPFSPAGITKDEELAILSGCYGMGTLVATPIFGYLGDRFGCRRPLIAGAILLALSTALLAYAPNFGVMIVARLLQGVAAAATWTSGLAIVAENYSGNRVQMMGYAMMGSTSGSVIGPIMAGTLEAVGGYRLPFLALLGVIAVELIAVFIFVPNDARNVKPETNALTLLLDKEVLVPAFAVVLAASAWNIVESLLPIHVARSGATPLVIGNILVFSTTVYGLSAPLVAKVVGRFGMRKTVAGGTIAMALTIPLIAVTTNPYIVALAASLVNISYAMLLNPQSAQMGDVVESRGLKSYCAVYSVYNVAYSIGTIGTSTVASVLLPHFTTLVVFVCIGAFMLLCIPVLLAARKNEPAPSVA